MKWTAHGREAGDGVTDLVAGSEALLCGQYAEYLLLRGRRVPVWAWVNLLAHGTAEDFGRSATGIAGHPSSGCADFHDARTYLAGEILRAIDAGDSLASIQARVLVPLELQLMRRATECWGATDLIEAVVDALTTS